MDRTKLPQCILYEPHPRRRGGDSIKSSLTHVFPRLFRVTDVHSFFQNPPADPPRYGVIHFPPLPRDLHQAIASLFSAHPQARWILLGSRHDFDRHAALLKRQSVFFLETDGLDPRHVRKRLLQMAQQLAGSTANTETLSPPADNSYGLDGDTLSIRQVRRKIAKVCATDTPVLICGETGTGKEMVARGIHRASPRRSGPFVAINCGAIPPTLIQSELFGHEAGAFTGAGKRRVGMLESANGGTLFLDEIAELPLELQVNLLRFLQEKSIYRVGGEQPVSIDARIVAATHVDLQAAVCDNRFRQDLYYRLAVVQIDMPPLRERGNDISTLADLFLRQVNNEHAPGPVCFSDDALAALRQYPWPGNIRELMNCIQRAAVMCENGVIQVADLGLALQPLPNNGDNASITAIPQEDTRLEDTRLSAEKSSLELTLQNCNHNITRASRQLGISRTSMYRLMKKHRLGRAAPTGPDR